MRNYDAQWCLGCSRNEQMRFWRLHRTPGRMYVLMIAHACCYLESSCNATIVRQCVMCLCTSDDWFVNTNCLFWGMYSALCCTTIFLFKKPTLFTRLCIINYTLITTPALFGTVRFHHQGVPVKLLLIFNALGWVRISIDHIGSHMTCTWWVHTLVRVSVSLEITMPTIFFCTL